MKPTITSIIGLCFAFLFSQLQADEIIDVEDAANTNFNYADFRFELINHLVVDTYQNWAPDLDWQMLRMIYAERKLIPIWFNNNGLNKRANLIKTFIENADEEALSPNDYHIVVLTRLWEAKRISNLAKLELLLTDALIRYCMDVHVGYQNPRAVDFEWYIPPRKIDKFQLITSVVNAKNFKNAIASLPPQNPAYKRLKNTLKRYRAYNELGAWRRVGGWRTMRIGSNSYNVGQLRERLMREGYYVTVPFEEDVDLFDRNLEKSVKKYQIRNGLKPDGIVGRSTRYALNIPVSHRINQIIQNMERWRWLPRDLGDRYIVVNMAGYKLYYIVADNVDLEMRVIIGLPYRATPAFADEIEYIEMNPTWSVPPRIAAEDFLPKLREDTNFLKVNHIRVFENWKDNAKEVDPKTIDWNSINDKNFNFKFEQEPGKRNSLGRIKFIFPNNYSIYLHDTPSRSLFNEPERTFSSGCIRIARPISLAERFLGRNDGWTKQNIRKILNTDTTLRIDLNKRIPIYLLYWTAWVEEDGSAHFRRDIYQRNNNLTVDISNDAKT